jgi:hypothetical protein
MNLLELYNIARRLDYNSFAEFVSCEIDSEVEIKPKKKEVIVDCDCNHRQACKVCAESKDIDWFSLGLV